MALSLLDAQAAELQAQIDAARARIRDTENLVQLAYGLIASPRRSKFNHMLMRAAPQLEAGTWCAHRNRSKEQLKLLEDDARKVLHQRLLGHSLGSS